MRSLLPLVVLALAPLAVSAEKLFVAKPFSSEGFSTLIEGPACDAAGNLYCVGFHEPRQIARVTPDGRAEVFVSLAEGSWGNGIRFDRAGHLLVADYKGHNVLRINPTTRGVTVYAHHDGMNQPNDLAIASDGTLYASDPNWKNGTGQVWRIATDGTVHREAAEMGTTNGIDVSPDGRTLYVNESLQRNVWSFPIRPDGSLGEKRLIRRFDDFGFDGMRCDVDGNLYITRHGKGTVIKMTPEGKVLREVDVLGPNPSNICFGGKDGRTAYVTEAKTMRLIQFRVDRPGLEWVRGQRK